MAPAKVVRRGGSGDAEQRKRRNGAVGRPRARTGAGERLESAEGAIGG
jgi:hypothetical protein